MVGGWMDEWMHVKASLRTDYSFNKICYLYLGAFECAKKLALLLTIKPITLPKYLPNTIYIIGRRDWIGKIVFNHTYIKNQR
jgi:hypothetical protein